MYNIFSCILSPMESNSLKWQRVKAIKQVLIQELSYLHQRELFTPNIISHHIVKI